MENIWWKHITRAKGFINHIAQAAEEKRLVCFYLPAATCPWPAAFYDQLDYVLKKHSGRQTNRVLACPETDFDGFLLEQYVKSDRAADFRPNLESLGTFIGRHRDIVLHSHRLIVTNINSYEKLTYWLHFTEDYLQAVDKASACASFLLQVELPQYQQLQKNPHDIRALSFADYANHYSLLAYASLVLADLEVEPRLQPYLIELTASLCQEDVELCHLCLAYQEAFLQNPLEFLQETISSCTRSNGTHFANTRPQEEIKRLIWQAQLKTIFPLIENYRLSFLRRHSSQLEEIMLHYPDFKELTDFEINHLMYWYKNNRLLMDPHTEQLLSSFYRARNLLAHLTPLAYEDVLLLCKHGSHA